MQKPYALTTGTQSHPCHPPRTFPPTYLLASWIPLRVVVPSRLTNSRRLLSVGTPGKMEAEWGSEAREPPGTVPLSLLAAHPGTNPCTPPALAAHPQYCSLP